MRVHCANGEVEFRRHVSANAAGAILEGIDGDPGIAVSKLVVDERQRLAGYVSLRTKPIRIAAANFEIITLGDIKRIGWSNIVLESSRDYCYDRGTVIRELVSPVATWDGGLGEQSPFYFGNFYSTPNDDDAGDAVETFDEDYSEPVIFNDEPCQPPSYEVWLHNGVPLGRGRLSDTGELMDRVIGEDKYLACLVIVDTDDVFHMLWSVAWTVVFDARVFFNDPYDTPNVVVNPNSTATVNHHHVYDSLALVRIAATRRASGLSKSYTLLRPVAQPVLKRRNSF